MPIKSKKGVTKKNRHPPPKKKGRKLTKTNPVKKKVKDVKDTIKKGSGRNDVVIMLNTSQGINLCANAEKEYKNLLGKSMKPKEKDAIIDSAKKYILDLCEAKSDDFSVHFTNSVDEANRVFLCSCVNAYKKMRGISPHVVISSSESEDLTKYAISLRDSGQIELTFIRTNIYGCILSEHIDSSLQDNTCCVLITHINQEMGSVNNITKIAEILHRRRIPLHSDCTHLFGKHKLDLTKTDLDSASITFDKIGGPIGIGANIIKNALIEGYKLAEHSMIYSNSYQNIPVISSSIESVKCNLVKRLQKNKHMLEMRNLILSEIGKKFHVINYPDFINSDDPPLNEKTNIKARVIIFGPPTRNESYYTPNILSFAIMKDKSAEEIKEYLEKRSIIIGVPNLEDLHLYSKLNIPEDVQKNIIRISLSDSINADQIKRFCSCL